MKAKQPLVKVGQGPYSRQVDCDEVIAAVVGPLIVGLLLWLLISMF